MSSTSRAISGSACTRSLCGGSPGVVVIVGLLLARRCSRVRGAACWCYQRLFAGVGRDLEVRLDAVADAGALEDWFAPLQPFVGGVAAVCEQGLLVGELKLAVGVD